VELRVKSQKSIHPVTLFVVIHVLALGLAVVAVCNWCPCRSEAAHPNHQQINKSINK